MPAKARGRIQAENDGPVYKMRANMPKVRYKLRSFAQVYPAKRRLATVTVEVNVEHADLIAEGDLQGFSYRSWTHHSST